MLPRVAITMGDPAGIGPEILLRACADARVRDVAIPVAYAHPRVLARVADRLALPMPADIRFPDDATDAEAIEPGHCNALSGALSGIAIEHAIAAALKREVGAVATAPISKAAIHAAGIPFPGHTEWFAARCQVSDETMLMYHRDLAVALVTVHCALRDVPNRIEPHRIVTIGQQLAAALKRIRGRTPRLAVLGLNPHAGEDGLFGDEERSIRPAIYELLQLGIDCDGPLPADTAFTPANRKRYDGYIAMYHDQGLTPFKALCFDEGVNVTLGLPIVRTSVDHGTAVDIAWQGIAQHQSMIEAIRLAAALAQ